MFKRKRILEINKSHQITKVTYNNEMIRRMFSSNFSVVLWTRSWKPFRASKKHFGDVWDVFWTPLGNVLGVLGGAFGPSWWHLGRLAAQDALKNSRRRPQELLKMAPGGPKTPQKGAKRVPRDPPKGPRGHLNNPQTLFR